MPRTYILGGTGAPRRFGVPPSGGAVEEPRKRGTPNPRLGGPLSNLQKAKLCILAAQSHDLDGPLDADQHRHDECMKAVGKPGLTACVQDDWKPLLAHFLALNGDTGRAFEAAIEHGTEPKRVAMWKLQEALRKAKLPMAYAASIARRQHHCEPADLAVNQIWQLVFTINNRGASRRRKAA